MTNLKPKSGICSNERGKEQAAQRVSYQNHPRLPNKEPWWRGVELALYLVMWLAMCLVKVFNLAIFEVDDIFEVDAIFEVDDSLKWVPEQSKLKSGTCVIERKANCQGLCYSYLK